MTGKLCDSIQETLVARGPKAFADDPDSRHHLVTCDECFAFLESLGELDGRLRAMPPEEPPPALVEQTLAAIRAELENKRIEEEPTPGELRSEGIDGSPALAAEPSPAARPSRWRRRLKSVQHFAAAVVVALWRLMCRSGRALARLGRAFWAAPAALSRLIAVGWQKRFGKGLILLGGFGVAAAGVLVVGVGMMLAPASGDIGKDDDTRGLETAEAQPVARPPSSKGLDKVKSRSRDLAAEIPEGGTLDNLLGGAGKGTAVAGLGSDSGVHLGMVHAHAEEQVAPLATQDQPQRPEKPARTHPSQKPVSAATGFFAFAGRNEPREAAEEKPGAFVDQKEKESRDGFEPLENLSSVTRQAQIVPFFQNGQLRGFKLFNIRPHSFWAQLGLQNGDAITHLNGVPLDSPEKVTTLGNAQGLSQLDLQMWRRGQRLTMHCERTAETYHCQAYRGPKLANHPRVGAFLARYQRLENLSFKPATGYWANTYIPGDPKLRLLYKRLLSYDRGLLNHFVSQSLKLEDRARQYHQPFDPPASSALAVYLHANERGITERKRLIVQVGLQATPRHSGRRPAMNIGIVLDLRGPVGTPISDPTRALLEAFVKARDIGDRFFLVVAGKPGGLIVEPEAFRHGPITVAHQNLFATGSAAGRISSRRSGSTQTLDLEQALTTAYEAVSRSDDPSAPLGSSALVLVTAQNLAADLSWLEQTAHERAVLGIPLSVVSLGAPPDQIDRLVLAGQGNRRLLGEPKDALLLVRQELSAVSRVVARAVRLRIRLAPGVELVDVLGSHRLDEARAEQVRQAEKSIDLRLSRNLGIIADRGEDEDGIQVVIPSFHAGDNHVFLLDLVASGPGPVADVTVRYKDLVYLKNGITRDNLTLDRRAVAQGPLERNVLKNLLGYELSLALARASQELAAGSHQAALTSVRDVANLLAGVQKTLPGFEQDRDLFTDILMLEEYALLLASAAVHVSDRRAHLSDSLRLAGLLKILPRPTED